MRYSAYALARTNAAGDLNNWCIHYGASPSKPRQALVGLGWGDAENYKNAGNLNPLDSDNQGIGILPRSVDGITQVQKQILATAQARKAAGKASSVSVFSHFTLINYGGSVPFYTSAGATNVASLPVKDGAFEACNTGTFQQNQKWYLQECVNAQGKEVDYHFSGHSHRAGVYLGEISQSHVNYVFADDFNVTTAKEQSTKASHLGPKGQTALIVSSSGGPVGVQNFANELCDGTDSWNLRPASGTLVDPNTHTVQRVVVNTDKVPSAKPRLCVALDYLHLGKPQALRFEEQVKAKDEVPTQWNMELNAQMQALNCIAGVKLWVFVMGEASSSTASRGGNASEGWKSITPSYIPTANGATVVFTPADAALLKTLMGSKESEGVVSPMFAEVALKQPSNPALKTNLWAADMNCADPWVFPVQLSTVPHINKNGKLDGYRFVLGRPSGEHGEIPMWEWLFRSYKDKGYADPKAITSVSAPSEK